MTKHIIPVAIVCALCSPAVAQDSDRTKYDWGIADCVSDHAVLLGKQNDEDASTVVKAAFSKCEDVVTKAAESASLMVLTNSAARKNSIYNGRYEPLPFGGATSVSGMMTRWKEGATNKAIAALLEARASRRAEAKK